MEIPIAEFLKKLDVHLQQFDDEVYPQELRLELLSYYQQFFGLGDFVDNIDDDLKQELYKRMETLP